MFKINAELLGSIQKTDKGFIGQFLIKLPSGEKDVIKVFSKSPEKLKTGELEVTQNFFFLV
jgi:hypothetical protein